MPEAPRSSSENTGLSPAPRKHELTLFQAVAGTTAIAIAVAVLVLVTLVWTLGLADKIRESTSAIISLTQLSFALVAGVGAVTGLVIAYRKHQLEARADAREDRRLFNERFGTAATQLASDLPAVRLAGIYSMAGLADDWAEGQQQCIDVLCANVRRAYAPEPSIPSSGFDEARVAWKDNQEFRHTVVRVIAEHLRPDSEVSWQGRSFDFTDATFDGGDFNRVQVGPGTRLRFTGARFAGGLVNFTGTEVTGGMLDFSGAKLVGGVVDFTNAQLAKGLILFLGASFADGKLDFKAAQLHGGSAVFFGTHFAGATVSFFGSQFLGTDVNLTRSVFDTGNVFLEQAIFADGAVSFYGVRFSGGLVSFTGSRFTGASLDFAQARFAGGLATFAQAEFTAGRVDLSEAVVLASGPTFDFDPAQPPPAVLLPPGRPGSTG